MIALQAADALLAVTTNVEPKKPGMDPLQVLFNVLTFLAASAAAGFSWHATRQREGQGKREEWWRRFQWAADVALDGDGKYGVYSSVGIAAIGTFAESPLAGDDEVKTAVEVANAILLALTAEIEELRQNGIEEVSYEEDGDGSEGHEDAPDGEGEPAGSAGSPAQG